jgi:stearoyl-CoA desaturase (delta-9 desaturase)
MAQGTLERTEVEVAPVKGIAPMVDTDIKLQRRAVLALTILPFAGFVVALISLWGHGLSVFDIAIMTVMYVVTGLGITVGYHRLLTHRSFDCPQWVRHAFAVAGSMAVEGPTIGWVADHRRHHAYADKEGDPHSPHLDAGDGFPGVVRGLWHAHIGWMFKEEQTDRERWAPDMLKDPVMVRIDRAFPWLALVSFVLPAVVGLLVTRSFAGAVSAFLWASLVRVFLLHHVTWSVNSICHFYGERPFETTDYSTNNWMLSLVSFGESWHNNHHAFPTSAVHGIGRWQLDSSAGLISLLERMGLARNVKRPTTKQLSNVKT